MTVKHETESAVESRSPEETIRLGAILGELCRGGDVILLEGPLGAGKTVFAKGVARGLGVDHMVRSPSFVLLSRHPGRTPMVHVDLYRVDDEAAVEELGLEEEREDGVLVVEWGEKLAGRWQESLHIRFEETGSESRRLVVTAGGETSRQRLGEWLERCEP